MEKITAIPLPRGKKVLRYFVGSDWHIDHLHKPSYEIIKQAAMDRKPSERRLIICGDFLDAAFLMAKNEGYKRWIKSDEGMDQFFVPNADEELALANKILDDLQTVFTEIIFIEGNHDWRYRNFQTICPSAYAHNFDYKARLKFVKRGISFVAYNSWLDIGDNLSITHGMYHGSTCHKKHYEAATGRSVIFGHIHRFECKAFTSRGHTRQVWSLPAMSELNPHYIKNSETNWSNGFGELVVRSDSLFNFNIYQVWDGVTYIGNKRYEVT